jgi:putative MFS transporter
MTQAFSSHLDLARLRPIHWFVLIAAALGMMFDGFDSQSLAFALPLIKKEWNLGPELLGALGSYSFVGLLFGSLLASALADRIGRKKAMALSIFVYSIFTGAVALAPNYTWLAVFRFLTGLGLGGLIPIATAWVSEFLPIRVRAFATSAVLSAFLFGWVVASAVAIAVIPPFGWRAIFVVGVVPAILAVIMAIWAPESPRWLLAQGRREDAGRIVKQIDPSASLESVRDSHVTSMEKLKWGMLFSSDFRATSIMLAILFFFIQIFGYGISVWLPTLLIGKGLTIVKTYTYTLLINLGPIAGSFVMGWLLDVWGRRSTFLVFWIAAAICTVLFAFATNPVYVVLLGFGLMFFGIATNVCLDTITAEIYPTDLRASAVGWGLGIGRLGGIAGPYLGGVILSLSIPYAGFFLIFAAPVVIDAIVSLSLRYAPSRASLESAADVAGQTEPLRPKPA